MLEYTDLIEFKCPQCGRLTDVRDGITSWRGDTECRDCYNKNMESYKEMRDISGWFKNLERENSEQIRKH